MNKKKGSKKNASSDMASLQNTPPGWNEQRQVVVKTQKKQKLNKLWIRIKKPKQIWVVTGYVGAVRHATTLMKVMKSRILDEDGESVAIVGIQQHTYTRSTRKQGEVYYGLEKVMVLQNVYYCAICKELHIQSKH